MVWYDFVTYFLSLYYKIKLVWLIVPSFRSLQCNNCAQLVIHPEQRFNFFSDYSQMVSCPACGVQDAHFCKNISVYLRGQEAEQVSKQAWNEVELAI